MCCQVAPLFAEVKLFLYYLFPFVWHLAQLFLLQLEHFTFNRCDLIFGSADYTNCDNYNEKYHNKSTCRADYDDKKLA
jgi:hypothetical protein